MSNTKNTKYSKEAVAYRLSVLRRAERFSQEDLAYKLDGVSRSVIANVESGRQYPSRYLIECLCEKLPINAAWLLLGEEPMYRKNNEESFHNHPSQELTQEEIDSIDPGSLQTAHEHASEVWERFEALLAASASPKEKPKATSYEQAGLTTDESEILDIYRDLSTDERKAIITLGRAALAARPAKGKPP